MNNSVAAVEVKDLFFYYLSPQKKIIAPWFPLHRVVIKKHVAVDSVTTTFRAGRITALLGRNGSGKTSLIKLITGVRLPQAGEIRVFGASPRSVKMRIGVCLGASLIYNRLSARENLEYFGQLYGLQNLNRRIDELSEMLDLRNVLDDMVETFSYGMKAKLALARSMIHSPDLLILDEPTLGIDFELASEIRKFIRSLKCSVILTTHYMEEAEMLCDDLTVISKGKIIASGDKSSVLKQENARTVGEAFAHILADEKKADTRKVA